MNIRKIPAEFDLQQHCVPVAHPSTPEVSFFQPLLLLLASLFRKCKLRRTALEISPTVMSQRALTPH